MKTFRIKYLTNKGTKTHFVNTYTIFDALDSFQSLKRQTEQDFLRVLQIEEFDLNEENLEFILLFGNFNVPEKRITDINWLKRNLSIHNSHNPLLRVVENFLKNATCRLDTLRI